MYIDLRIALIIITVGFLIWSFTHSTMTHDPEKDFENANRTAAISEFINIALVAYLIFKG